MSSSSFALIPREKALFKPLSLLELRTPGAKAQAFNVLVMYNANDAKPERTIGVLHVVTCGALGLKPETYFARAPQVCDTRTREWLAGKKQCSVTDDEFRVHKLQDFVAMFGKHTEQMRQLVQLVAEGVAKAGNIEVTAETKALFKRFAGGADEDSSDREVQFDEDEDGGDLESGEVTARRSTRAKVHEQRSATKTVTGTKRPRDEPARIATNYPVAPPAAVPATAPAAVPAAVVPELVDLLRDIDGMAQRLANDLKGAVTARYAQWERKYVDDNAEAWKTRHVNALAPTWKDEWITVNEDKVKEKLITDNAVKWEQSYIKEHAGDLISQNLAMFMAFCAQQANGGGGGAPGPISPPAGSISPPYGAK